ncbi:helix-turn-helix transcriptional regulator [Aliiglaciecola sp. CAU 1673]|uniref:helix-turn-helix transcriptional regulator n=1 Tax=Aliiglaciecola sp. CAU 1673 TaxID=3032595 RepID=UPI0023DC0654|nr:helix-turn-helix transcriptional regulator [Aliiglaciecola sp. CAU 1673]MDF2177939.1 helix-turn-helix transcriptional regulator [Aliiglaciecola sp. CAU 1673]
MANLSVAERKAIMQAIEKQLAQDELSIGEAIKAIRTELYGMTQTQYARFIKVSDKTLRDVEKGNTDARLSVINKLLAPGGFTLSAKCVKTSL